jgi:hypothetical protein
MSADASIEPTFSREQSLSALCAIGCAVLAFAIPLTVAALWALGSWPLLALVRLVPPDLLPELRGEPQAWQRLIGAAVCLLPAAFVSYGLLRIRRTLLAFAGGEFFAAKVVAGLKAYAGANFWAAALSMAAVPVLAVTLTLANPTGHHEFTLDLSGAPVLNLLGAAILWVIASVMARASDVARENEQFV